MMGFYLDRLCVSVVLCVLGLVATYMVVSK